MLRALLILLMAAAAGEGRADPAESPRPAAANRHDSVKQICERLPKAPDKSLNDVALQAASDEANQWLKKNAAGAAVQAAGDVFRLARRTVYGKKPPATKLDLGFRPHPGRWRGFTLRVSYSATFSADRLDSLSRVENGDKATVKGTIASMSIHWQKNGQATLDVSLRDCTLVKAEKHATDAPIPTKSTPPLTDVLKWTGSGGKTFHARLLGLHDEKAYFSQETGKMLVMPMKSMSTADQTKIRQVVEKNMKSKKTEKGASEVRGIDPFSE